MPGQPTRNIASTRRRADSVTPIPKPKKQKGAAKQEVLLFDERSAREQQ
jgi:type III restriction enzyme